MAFVFTENGEAVNGEAYGNGGYERMIIFSYKNAAYFKEVSSTTDLCFFLLVALKISGYMDFAKKNWVDPHCWDDPCLYWFYRNRISLFDKVTAINSAPFSWRFFHQWRIRIQKRTRKHPSSLVYHYGFRPIQLPVYGFQKHVLPSGNTR